MRLPATAWLAWLCLFAASLPPVSAQDAVEDERLLKAAFVYNFAKFTRWPPGTWPTRQAPLTLCIFGTDDMADSLSRLGGETVQGRPVAIRAQIAMDGIDACQILYIAGSEHAGFVGLVRQASPYPVLTISGIRGFADAGGMIQLYRDSERIRFKINLAVARASHLELSAILLDLAELVDGRGVR